MRAVVTGAAGFIGSHLVDALLALAGDHHVVGVDCFTPTYGEAVKRRNLARAAARPRFELVEADLRDADLAAVLDGADVVFHHAAQPGVRVSWEAGFADCAAHNVLVTQRLLEASRTVGVDRFVYASSSSVYGNAAAHPTTELDETRPHSPYGVTKLAGEHLCDVYAANWAVPTVSLRYFTVYGPRQRPDMAIHRFTAAALAGRPVPLFGDGSQVRDFTYVGDVVAATLAARTADVAPGTVVNVAGGDSVTVAELLVLLSDAIGHPVEVDRRPAQPGDVDRTGGSVERAAKLLGWAPATPLRQGLAAQVAWHRWSLDPSAGPEHPV